MNKKALILLALFLCIPLLFCVVIFIGVTMGLSESAILKLVLCVFPVALLGFVLVSYLIKECLYIRIPTYQNDPARVAITPTESPVLFHFLQLSLMTLSVVLLGAIHRWDINLEQSQMFQPTVKMPIESGKPQGIAVDL